MKKFYICLAALIAAASPMQAQEANYDHPTALRYLATISNTRQQPVCNLTTRNPINNGAFLWAPVGSSVKYTDTSTGAPQSWKWETSGGELRDPASQDASILYDKPGTYQFPKLTVTYPDAQKTTEPALKLKVGGVAELCLADCREWLQTYALGVNAYDDQGGAVNGTLGGTNKLDIIGVGNLFMTANEEGFLDGVNVYLPSKPTKWKDGAKIGIRIWMANIGQSDVQLAAIPLEGGEFKFEDIKTEEDGAWVPVKGGAVLHLECTLPIELFGKPMIFIDVYGWSDDPSTEDFKMLMDVMPNKEMAPEHAQNMLAHNSFVRLKGENDYLRPVSYYGGNYGSCMICPIVRGGETPLGSVTSIVADNVQPLQVTVTDGAITFTGDDAAIEIANIAGQALLRGNITDGMASFPAETFQSGIYVARTSSGQVAKFAVR